jgi:hypothetical protein
MSLHQTIKEQIKAALRAKDTIRLDALRGLNALALNELLTSKVPAIGSTSGGSGAPTSQDLLPDDRILALIRKSVKQRKDSIEQFTKGGREDLVAKEQAELKILETFMPAMMPLNEIKLVVRTRIETLKSQGAFDPKSAGKLTGMLMKELAGKADGADVKAAIDELLAK